MDNCILDSRNVEYAPMRTCLTVPALMLATLTLCNSSMFASHATASDNASDRDHEIGVQAYIYAYPMMLMEMTRRVSTNVEAPTGSFAPMNQFAHLRAFPDPSFKDVVRPNADTLYSIVWFDVSKEPMILSVPETDRYYMMPMLDFWTEVFAVPGSRTSGNQAGSYAIHGPNWEGKLPEGVEPIRSPTNLGWIIGRTQTNGPSDYDNVHRIQDGYKLTPLSRWGTSSEPTTKKQINTEWDTKTPPPVQVANMDAEAYFELFATLLKDNPPHEIDWNMVTQLRQIGLIPGEEFEFSELPQATQDALKRAVVDAQKIIAAHSAGESVNGWDIARAMMGSYGAAYTQRAYVALIGLGANVPEDAIYPMSVADKNGRTYHGRNRYTMHFEQDELPPVNGFWSITLYDSDGYMVENKIKRYAIGDRDELSFNEDGSLDIFIQHESPGKDRESNWLHAPADDFNLTLRLYWPRLEILTGEWNPPPVKAVGRLRRLLPR
jgi:hypothetical protein